MNESVVPITILALLSVGYAALCARLGTVWGIDPGRETPAKMHGKAQNALLLLTLCLIPLLMPAWQAARYAGGLQGAMLAAGAAAFWGGVTAYAAAFVGLRRGGVCPAQIAREELSGAASAAMRLLACLSAAAIGALSLRGAMEEAGFAQAVFVGLWPCALRVGVLAGLCALLGGEISGSVARETDAAPLTLGSAAVAALTGLLLFTAGEAVLQALPVQALLVQALAAALHAATAAACVFAGGRALSGLRARRTGRPGWPYPACVLAAAAAAAQIPGPLLSGAAGVLGGAYALAVLAVCALWLRRMGRGLLF